MPVATSGQDFMIAPQEFVLYGLAFATPLDTTHRYTRLVQTEPVQTYTPTQGLTAMLALWMDDFDANMSLSKLNRKRVFGVVGTILFVNAMGHLVGAYSNLMAAGNKKTNHEALLTALQHAFTEYTHLHYCGPLQECVQLQCHLLHCVCDQPAKRDLCGLKQGNSTLHACFGYSFDFKQLAKPFHACDTCQHILMETEDLPPPCAVCHAWHLPTGTAHLPYTGPIIPELTSTIPELLALNHGGGQLTIGILQDTWQECWHDLTNNNASNAMI